MPTPHRIESGWAAVHDAAAVVAMLAGLPDDLHAGRARAFPAALRQAGGWRLAMAAQALEDLAAVMEPGLSALLSLHCGGRDTQGAARVLWEEFAAARGALLGIIFGRS